MPIISLESRLEGLGRELTFFRGETMLTWALGANIAVTIAILGVLLRLH